MHIHVQITIVFTHPIGELVEKDSRHVQQQQDSSRQKYCFVFSWRWGVKSLSCRLPSSEIRPGLDRGRPGRSASILLSVLSLHLLRMEEGPRRAAQRHLRGAGRV